MLRREQTVPMALPHVYAMTLIGSGFLIEPVPVAATHAAHRNFSPIFLPKSYGKFTTPEQGTALPLCIVYLAFELSHDAENDFLLPLWQASALLKYGACPLVGQGLQHLLVEN